MDIDIKESYLKEERIQCDPSFALVGTRHDFILPEVTARLTWIPDIVRDIIVSFLQKPFAGMSEVEYFRIAERHMLIDIQHCYDDTNFELSSEYLFKFGNIWRRFDPEHTGCVLFKDIVSLINALYDELEIDSWEYDPSEYPNICKSFPNVVVTYVEFCLWTECEESYADMIGLESNRNTSDNTKWRDNKLLISNCLRHGEVYMKDSVEKEYLRSFANIYVLLDEPYLSVNEIRKNVDSTLKHYPFLVALEFKVNHKCDNLILRAETRNHPGKLCLYDFCLNLFRPMHFAFVPRKELIQDLK